MDDESLNQFSGLSNLEQVAAHLNELFTSLMNSGFTEKQALYLVSETMIAGSSYEGE
jgi:hypothetical protein